VISDDKRCEFDPLPLHHQRCPAQGTTAARGITCESRLFDSEADVLNWLDRQPSRTPAYAILYDSRGQQYTSEEFAEHICRIRDEGTHDNSGFKRVAPNGALAALKWDFPESHVIGKFDSLKAEVSENPVLPKCLQTVPRFAFSRLRHFAERIRTPSTFWWQPILEQKFEIRGLVNERRWRRSALDD
jgi:hypothetical protein